MVDEEEDRLTSEEEAELEQLEQKVEKDRDFWQRFGPYLAGALVVAVVALAIVSFSGDSGTSTVETDDDAAPAKGIIGSITVRTDSDDHSITDRLQASDASFRVGSPCSGRSISSGYGDLAPGAGVTVKNERGEIIATGALRMGEWIRRGCRMTFSVPELPKAKFYELEIGGRGEQRYSRQQLEAALFHVDLTIGG